MAPVMVSVVVVAFVVFIVSCRSEAKRKEAENNQMMARFFGLRGVDWHSGEVRKCPLDDRFTCALPGCVTHNICTARFDEEGV
jgi:hypothetical protein